jgi:hypothetical protein
MKKGSLPTAFKIKILLADSLVEPAFRRIPAVLFYLPSPLNHSKNF